MFIIVLAHLMPRSWNLGKKVLMTKLTRPKFLPLAKKKEAQLSTNNRPGMSRLHGQEFSPRLKYLLNQIFFQTFTDSFDDNGFDATYVNL